jgi:hypothetical protein
MSIDVPYHYQRDSIGAGVYIVLYGTDGSDVVYAGLSKNGAAREARGHRDLYSLRRDARGLKWDVSKSVYYIAEISPFEHLEQTETTLISYLYCGRKGIGAHGHQMVNNKQLYFAGDIVKIINEGDVPPCLPHELSYPSDCMLTKA